MKCKRCYGHLDHSLNDLMDFETAKKATEFYLHNRSPQTPPGYIMIFGGEPLLNWDTVKTYILWAKNQLPSYDLQLFTNGLKLSKEKIDFFTSNKVMVFISLDGDFQQHHQVRSVTLEAFSLIVSMIRYFKEQEPGMIIPYCVVNKKDLDALNRNISFIASLGVHNIAVAKEFGQDWTSHEQTTLRETLKQFPHPNFMIYPEATSNCLDCYPRQMMVYPNGDIYDLCYVCATVQVNKKLLKKKDLELFYMGNIHKDHILRLDVRKKRKTMHRLTFCPTITADYSEIA